MSVQLNTVISQSSEPLSTVDSLSFTTSPIPQLDEQIPDDDDHGKVRNMKLQVNQKQDSSLNYNRSLASYIKGT